jgi:hypothetical protein
MVPSAIVQFLKKVCCSVTEKHSVQAAPLQGGHSIRYSPYGSIPITPPGSCAIIPSFPKRPRQDVFSPIVPGDEHLPTVLIKDRDHAQDADQLQLMLTEDGVNRNQLDSRITSGSGFWEEVNANQQTELGLSELSYHPREPWFRERRRSALTSI